MPVGEFQEDLRLCEGVPVTGSPPRWGRTWTASRASGSLHQNKIFKNQRKLSHEANPR